MKRVRDSGGQTIRVVNTMNDQIKINGETLVTEARNAAKYAYCPYSKYAVGAVLLASDGTIWRGCNVENVSFGLSNCAERTALFSAVASGRRSFAALAIAGGTVADPAVPCGACRQVLAEFCEPSMPVFRAALSGGKILETTLGNLFPDPFSLHNS